MRTVTIYHGSKEMIDRPYLGGGKPYNDYGYGFYCTGNRDLANEWSCTEGAGGYVNQYQLDMDGLKVMRLNSRKYHILNWLAILLHNRTFAVTSGLMEEAMDYILESFLPPYETYDVIVGYRADDSYFKFSRAFLSGTISLEQLRLSMNLGKLGEQVVLKSEKAFGQILFIGADPTDYNIWFARRIERDRRAAQDFLSISAQPRAIDSVYVLDILREQWHDNDPRLR